MAIVIESYASANWDGVSNGAARTITKPTGLAEGDLMIAILGLIDEDATTFSISPPSGWTEVLSEQYTDGGSNATEGIWVYYKVASASDVAASNFGFQNDSGEGIGISGIIYRITGAGSPSSIQFAYDNDDSGSTSLTFTTTLTPAFANGYLFYIVVGGDSSGPNNLSAYAITNNNPTWTEAADYGDDGTLFAFFGAGNGASPAFAVAHASRPETTATGNATATCSTGGINYAFSVMMFLPPSVSVTASPSVIDITTSVVEPSVSGGATVSTSVIDITTSVIAPTVSFPADDWTNQSKNSSTWTNINKS